MNHAVGNGIHPNSKFQFLDFLLNFLVFLYFAFALSSLFAITGRGYPENVVFEKVGDIRNIKTDNKCIKRSNSGKL